MALKPYVAFRSINFVFKTYIYTLNLHFNANATFIDTFSRSRRRRETQNRECVYRLQSPYHQRYFYIISLRAINRPK